ncbi:MULTISPECIES: SDR family oxidoreductase [Rhizobium]|uniref:NAD-dependent nucleoside-diphosphate-sugar epimerase protein n=1 Tax=Rhizobium phaseoli TaxID=396 RepID=A0A192TC62_9HYPH|nr:MULTISPECIES: SDR family oxidoreductase [Rhizobium]ANL41061.1 NAD-dependent nucleoside-diphosphate-sugar epimerase protein [Rhizobium phaseoli]ANL53796.1 NAD-dependent nucleoside-diphosphate-sugar epimerase protein [Rhizobium phaseoli]ANL60049.1 NAD-dependent nucleoside-diphosphate-sugar epimerase protein [Rhizobium phaseoli]ANL85442.1 NAD-dependent nucleoside-diphosphate-sugar epimerase protein [Rhizobium phaseoli]ANL91951.1 NAD-dependent nucleoside-diphosphate-sugar epimerase protein [Rhi
MSSKILVIGATGTVGRHVVDGLLAKGEAVKAASRAGKPVASAEGVVFDYAKPETFGPAFDGVDRAYVLLASGYADSKGMLLPVIEAAAARKVKVVLQSAFGVDADDAIPYRQVEIALEKSGTPYVILRPNWFSDNFHTFWKPGIDHGQIALPAAEGKSSFIDARDVAASGVAALTSSSFDGKAFNLTGPEALSYTQAAAILSEAIGKPVSYNAVSDEALIDMLTGAGVSADYASFLASIFYPVREGWTAVVNGEVETLTGKAPRSLQTYAADYAAALKA